MVKPTKEEETILEQVEKSVCNFFGVTIDDIISRNITANITMARGYIYYILHVDKGISVNKIANSYFRTTRAVFWHINKVKHLLKQRAYAENYRKILELK